MSLVLRAIARHAAAAPDRPALIGDATRLDYDQLHTRIPQLAAQTRQIAAHAVALHADNSPDWVLADLAVLAAQRPCIPLPLFFTDAQLLHATSSAGVDAIFTDRPDEWRARGATPAVRAGPLHLMRLPRSPEALPIHAGTLKITFTSGSTGTPKGVCLPLAALDALAASLAALLQQARVDKHLCLLPLPVLLENLAGVYAALQAGAACTIPSLENVGLAGSQGLEVPRLLAALQHHRPHSVILLPQVLAAIVAALAKGAGAPEGLRLAAVGGARVGVALLERARALGLPVFEGYGLSECASVVAVNRPGAERPGSVGRPLPHQQVRIAPSGEIMVRGPHHLGYLGDAPAATEEIATGDLGHLDEDGFLHIGGRSKNLIISSFGRNISPEWVEAELQAQPGIQQCFVHGEARPHLVAVVVAPDIDDRGLDATIGAANARLPDYARVRTWLRADAPFSPHNGQLTANGRPRREALLQAYAARLDRLYAP